MRAGKIRHKVQIQAYESGGRSDSGATIMEWVTLATVWASIEQLRGRTLFAAQQANSETTVLIKMRWRPDVAATSGETTRIKHFDRIYQIEGRPMDVDGRRRDLEIMAKEMA